MERAKSRHVSVLQVVISLLQIINKDSNSSFLFVGWWILLKLVGECQNDNNNNNNNNNNKTSMM